MLKLNRLIRRYGLYEKQDQDRNFLDWLQAYTQILRGVCIFIIVRDNLQTSKTEYLLLKLQKGIACLRGGINNIEKTFPREQLLVVAYTRFSEAESLLGRFEARPREQAETLNDAVTAAEKAKFRDPFEAQKYQTLQSTHFARSEFELAENVAALGQSLNIANLDLLFGRSLIHWAIGVQLVDKTQRVKHFNSLIKYFEDSLLRTNYRDFEGLCHFCLGRFKGELCKFDDSRSHYQIAKKLNYRFFESCISIAWSCVEQEQFNWAEIHLDEALFQLGGSFQRYMKARRDGAPRTTRRRDWLGEPDEGAASSSEKQPLGRLLARALLLSALMRCERGDLESAERRLRAPSA